MRMNESESLSFVSLSDKVDNKQAKMSSVRYKILNLIITISMMILVTLMSFFFRHIGLHESNIIVAYILGVLLSAKFTEGYVYGIAASVIGVLTFNFFFTEPYYTFATYRPDYPVTFLIMLIAAIITSTTTAKVKQEARKSILREKRAQILYQFSKSLLKVRNKNQIVDISLKNIAKLFNRSVVISIINSSEALDDSSVYPFNNDDRANIMISFDEREVVLETFKNGKPAGAGTTVFLNSPVYYLPIKGVNKTLGVVGVSCFDNLLLSNDQKTLLEAVTSQIALAIEREYLSEKQQKSKIEMERERLRGNLLRAMSHDLRTPLTGIMGATATILDNDDVLDNKVKRELLQSVYEDATWLIHSVENILSMTRIDEGRVEIKKNMEAVEEIVAEAVSRIKKLASSHILKITMPNELIMLPMDGTLIEQVLVNLLDNAIKYTPDGSSIEIKIYSERENVVFEVSDNGNGISEENIPLIFNRFFTAATKTDTGRRGTGLGLAICKSIILAHGGEISAYNNSTGGATFRFILPTKESNNGK